MGRGVDSWMGGWHGGLPWQGHVESTMGIPWNSMGGLLDGWLAWRSSMARPCGEHHGHPMEFHGGFLDGWMAWRPSMARPCGEHHGHPMEFHGRVDSWMGGWHGGLPWQGHVENTMGIP